MQTIEERLLAADRATLLLFLGGLLQELTIRARSYYDQPDSHARMVETNEAIHDVSGHLRDMLDSSEEMTPTRAGSAGACAALLVPNALNRLLVWSRL